MRILLSAIACHPQHGSEASVGWKTALALAKHHEVHVLTSEENREGIEQFLSAKQATNLAFTYFGENATYHPNRLIARGESWFRYLNWMHDSLAKARSLTEIQQFDIVHHVTYSSWRVPSQLWQLDCPLVWGPIGGVAEYPPHLLGKLSSRSALFEIVRSFSNKVAIRSRTLRQCVRNATAVVASNRETHDTLLPLRGSKNGMHTLSPTFFTPAQVAALSFCPEGKKPVDPLLIFAGGNLIGSKGIIFALEAVKFASEQGIKCHFLIASGGPEVPFLKEKVRRLGLAYTVEFHLGFSGSAYHQKLHESHVFLLPSFRENAPGTILDAMLAGCVPVVVDTSAQGEIVTADLGLKVPVGSAQSISRGLGQCIVELARNSRARFRLGNAARQFVADTFTEENYVYRMNTIYEEAVATRI